MPVHGVSALFDDAEWSEVNKLRRVDGNGKVESWKSFLLRIARGRRGKSPNGEG